VRMQGGAGACFLLSLQPTGTECAPGKGIVRSNAEWNDMEKRRAQATSG